MTMWIVSDIRASVLFDGHADYRRRPSFQDDANSPRRRGRRGSDEAYPPSAEKVSCSVIDHAACQPTHRLWERSRRSMGVTARDPRHASRCSMRVHRKHECKDSTRVAGSIVDCAGISLRIACACFRGPTGRGDALRTHSVRVRIPAKAPAETRASTPPIQVLNAYLFWERYVGRTFHN